MATFDYSGPLTPSGNLRRRRIVDRVMRGGATAAAFLAVAILVIFIYSIVQRGASVISLSFLTHNPL
jgi:ABC-type phosphate transport system permease subunit